MPLSVTLELTVAVAQVVTVTDCDVDAVRVEDAELLVVEEELAQ